MWRAKLVKFLYKLNDYLYFLDNEFIRKLKKLGKRLVLMISQSDEKMLIKIHGMSFYIYPSPASIHDYLLKPYEPYTTELFMHALRPGYVVLDIGAQFGYFSLLVAKVVGQTGKVFAFEPDPINFRILNQNIQINGYENIVYPVQKAVGDTHKLVTLSLYKDSDSHGIFRHTGAAVKGEISVECVTIDEFLNGQAVDVIKMDIEGYEPYALEGMKQTISRSPSLILFAEFAPYFLRLSGTDPRDYLARLERLGFDIKVIDERSRSLRPIIEADFAQADPSFYTMLYCVRKL